VKNYKRKYEELVEAIRAGAPYEVIGYDRNGATHRAYGEGWNANAERLWLIAHDWTQTPDND
jgi:hypothetical protein